MAASPPVAESQNYLSRFATLAWSSLAQLVRSPSHSRRAEAARRAARHVLWLSAGLGAAIIVLMYAIDAWEIAQMPKRGTPSLWWVRILTDFGKDEYVLRCWGLADRVAIARRPGGIRARCCLAWERGCSSFARSCVQSGHQRNGIGRGRRLSAVRPTLHFALREPGLYNFLPATPRPPLRSLSLSAVGHRRIAIPTPLSQPRVWCCWLHPS
jgi:hypothetical protein